MSLSIVSLISAIVAAANPPLSKHNRRSRFSNDFAFLNPANQSFTYMHQDDKRPDAHSRTDYMGHITSRMRRPRIVH